MRKFVLSIVAVLSFVAMATAQNVQVSGTVAGEDGAPIVGATVVAKGTRAGTVTNAGGAFTLSAPKEGTLIVSFLGYNTIEVNIAGKSTVNVTLASSNQLIDNVVVTAMGITRSEKSIGYAATSVSGAELAGTRSTDALSALAGRVAGVQISSSTGAPGAANSVIIRGFSSLTSGNNQPLFIVDGVPIVNNFGSYESTDTRLNFSNGNGANMVSPDDIENMTVLKGAAATALYGSRAAGGVILITTKSGKKNESLSVDFNFGVQVSSVMRVPEMQNDFGMGWSGLWTDNENGSWGPRFDGKDRVYGPIYPGTNSQAIAPYKAQKDNVKEFFENGIMYSTSASVAGGSDKTTFYAGVTNISDNGIMPSEKDKYNITTLAFRGSHSYKKWLDVSASANLANSKTSTVMTGQGATMIDGLYEMPRNISILDLEDLNNPFNTPEYYFTPYGVTNPWYALKYNENNSKMKKIYGKVQVDIKPWDFMKFTYRLGYDYSDGEAKWATPRISLTGTPNEGSTETLGLVHVGMNRRYEINHDFMANFNKTFCDKFDIQAVVGLNVNERSSNATDSEITNLTIPTFYDLSNSSDSPSSTELFSKRRLVGLFADVQLGYNNLIFVGLTARNDWSSTLPVNNNNFFYPGVTGSFMFSELLNNKDVLSFGKFRIAWGKTGNDAGVYMLNPYYSQGFVYDAYREGLSFPINGINGYKMGSTLGSSSLAPEMTSEFELGMNLQFFQGRIGLDAAYYDRKSDGQIFPLGLDPASGYRFAVTNLGKVSNKGVELLLTTVPVKTRNFRWDLDFNFALNRSKVVSLPDDVGGMINLKQYTTNVDAVYMRAVVGQPLGTFYTYNTVKSPSGQVVVDQESGLPINTTTATYTGKDMNNKWTGGVSTAFTYKSITLSAVADIRWGGYMFSRTKDLMAFTGNSIYSLYNDRKTYIVPNSVNLINGQYVENTTPISSLDVSDGQKQLVNGFNFNEGSLMDRSFIKLRNVSLSYELPTKWVSKLSLKSVRLSLVGNNLLMWTPVENRFVDPETSTEGYDLDAMFGEMYSNPSCRRIGFNIQVKF